MGWNTRHSRLRKLREHMANVGRPVPGSIDEDRERLELIVHAARGALKATERMAALPFAERAKGCSPPASGERIFGDVAMSAKLSAERQTLADRKADLAAFQELHGLGPNGIAREVFRYELAAAQTLYERAQTGGKASTLLDPDNVSDVIEKLHAFPREEWDELLEGFDGLAAAVMAAA